MQRFLSLLILLLSNLITAQNIESLLSAKIDSVITADFNNSSVVSMQVYNLTKDSLVYSINEKLLLHPASNLKILTSSAGLYFLSPDYEFTTKLYYDGEIEGGTLKGNVYIKGGFDPDLTKEDLETFFNAIEDEGIEIIEGNIYADVSMMDDNFWGKGWMWDDNPFSDFPYMTALNINDDCVTIEIKPTNIGERASVNILPHSLFYTFENNLITDSIKSHFTVTRDWKNRKNHFTIYGVINVNEEPLTFTRNLVNTNFYAATLLKEILYREKITVLGIVDTSSVPENAKLLSVISRKFGDVIVNLNKTSDNLSAEMTLRALGSLIKPEGISAKDGIIFVDSLISITGLNPEDYKIVDGSGVSHYNLISTELVLNILRYFYYNEPDLYRILKESFPVAGIDGTLEKRMRNGNAFNNVHAKTGTLSGVSSLSGYLKTINGSDIAFSIFVQNYLGSSKKARNLQDKICEIIAGSEL